MPIHAAELADATDIAIVKDINLISKGSSPQKVTVLNDLAFFTASDGNTGHELWKTDGSEAGTGPKEVPVLFGRGQDRTAVCRQALRKAQIIPSNFQNAFV